MRPSWSSGKTLAANAGGRGFESHKWQNLLITFHSIRVECEELFGKTNKDSYKLTEKIIPSEMTKFYCKVVLLVIKIKKQLKNHKKFKT